MLQNDMPKGTMLDINENIWNWNWNNHPTISKIQNNDPPILSMYGAHRVQESMLNLPQWLQQYFHWHAEQSRNPQPDTKYIVVACFNGTKCGGTSDRLRALPYYLLVANQTQRVLLIKWTKPHDLSEFLVPPGDVDWRSRVELDQMIENHDFIPHVLIGYCGLNKFTKLHVEECLEKAVHQVQVLEGHDQPSHRYLLLETPSKDYTMINQMNMLYQKYSYQSEMPFLGMWEYPNHFGDIFRVMFEPVPELAGLVNRTMSLLGLVEDGFDSAHVRARFPVKSMPVQRIDKRGGFPFEGAMKDKIVQVAENAVMCASQLSKHEQKLHRAIFFASDSHHLTSYMMQNATTLAENVHCVGVDRETEPLHIDRDDGSPGSVPSDFYSGFEDLLIMGGSSCVSHGVGSFGSLGAALSGNQCRALHRIWNGEPIACPNIRAETHFVSVDVPVHELSY